MATIHLGTAKVYTCEATNLATGNCSATNTLIVIPGERGVWRELGEPWETTNSYPRSFHRDGRSLVGGDSHGHRESKGL